MVPSPTSYRVGSARERREVLRALAARFSTARERRARRRAVYYDTFDWRLHRSDQLLSLVEDSVGSTLRWASRRGRVFHRLALTEAPVFVWDLPAGAFRDDLGKVIEMRRLLPVVAVETGGEVLRILDGPRKTVARVEVELRRAAPPDPNARSRILPAVLRVAGVRGYDRELAELVRFMEVDLGLQRSRDEEVPEALEAIGRETFHLDSKLSLELHPDQRSDDALKSIHLALLRIIEHNERGTREALDSEFLHDFRVSVRRTRSALTQVKGVYPPEVVSHFRKEFSWLGDLTGPTRDLDVYLLKMPAYKATLPAGVREDLEPLSRFLELHQRIEQRRMSRSLGTRRYRELLASWRSFLESPSPAESELPHALEPIRSVASARIWKAYRRVLKKGRAIGPETPAEALHRLRIDCKKLRYLLEFFRSLFDKKTIGQLIKALKQLQDNLGDFNDFEVQQHSLVMFAHQMVEEKLATVAGLMAMGRLVEHLEEGQAKERELFHERFEQFSRRSNRRRFRELFKPREATP